MSLDTSQIEQARLTIADTMGDTASVETYTGDSANGPIYADPVSVTCNATFIRRLVLNGNGDEVISEVTLAVGPGDVNLFTPESRVTVFTRVCRVQSVSPATFKGSVVYAKVACS